MDIAWKQAGQHEIPGAAANREIIAYFRDAGHPEVQSDEVSWCAAFACACLERAGIKSPRSLLARDFLHFGTPIEQARSGAIAVFSRPPDPSHGHVGFVVGETADAVVLLGGNQANAVSAIHMPKARLLGYRWPAGAVGAADLKASGSRTIAAADSSIQAQALAGAAGASGLAASQVPDAAPGVADHLSHVANQAAQYQGVAATLMDAGYFLAHSWIWIAGIGAAYFGGKAIYHAVQVKKARVEDANTGTHAGTIAAAPSAERLIGGANAGSP